MSIKEEWRSRIERWRKVMPRLFYQKAGDIDFTGFMTTEQLRPEQALAGEFRPMPPGTKWGMKWDYAWFKGSVAIPKTLAGERVVARFGVGTQNVGGVESVTVMLNGHWVGAVDIHHKDIMLAREAKGGEKIDILAEAYAGHGPMECDGGPCPDGVDRVAEVTKPQREISVSSFGVWREELYQLWLDVETLAELRDNMADPDSLRAAEVEEALRQMTLIVDLELPAAEMMATVKAGREALKDVLSRHNGSTSPLMTCFGHGHLDVAWLWPLQESVRKTARTFGNQLALMDEYPEHKFLQSQPVLYQMAKDHYPELYERVKTAAKKGQWLAEGGMWVEADTNLVSGESLIRQFIHGKRFFEEEFGVDSQLLWLPDVFGYSGALPQIMAGCGVKNFSTQKIFWAYNGGEKFPYNIFWWEGIDGTRVLSYIHNDYNSNTTPAGILARWKERVQKEAFHDGRLLPFGPGDGGGGPTRDHVEHLRRQKDLEGMPRCEIAAPDTFFNREWPKRLPVWAGELYFQAHRGTYTTQAKTKKGNRRSEIALREAELWGALALAEGKAKFPAAVADKLWKDVLVNQFHDILPGSSIERVYQEAEAAHAHVIATANAIAAESRGSLLDRDNGAVTVFNSLSWEREALVALPDGVEALQDVPCQKLDGKAYALVSKLPSCGHRTFRKAAVSAAAPPVKTSVKGLENECLKIVIDAAGEITSIIDKSNGMEVAAGVCNQLRMFKDVPSHYDAWDIDNIYKLQPFELGREAKVTVVSEGAAFGAVRVERTLHDSKLVQDIVLRRGSRRVDFVTRVDWREKHKMLKVCFPVSVRAEDALNEIQFGHVRRPTHASRFSDTTRFEVCNHKWTALAEESRGAAVLNDCKYGVSVEGGKISLTLLRAPLAPDMHADQGVQEFTYSFYCWDGAFKDSGLVREGYDLNMPAVAMVGAAPDASLFQVDSPNVIIEAVKPAEDGSGDVVVRLYESSRTSGPCRLSTALPVKKLVLTDMLERHVQDLALDGDGVKLMFKPFEIKTLRLKL